MKQISIFLTLLITISLSIPLFAKMQGALRQPSAITIIKTKERLLSQYLKQHNLRYSGVHQISDFVVMPKFNKEGFHSALSFINVDVSINTPVLYSWKPQDAPCSISCVLSNIETINTEFDNHLDHKFSLIFDSEDQFKSVVVLTP